jgi:hypothetical protein
MKKKTKVFIGWIPKNHIRFEWTGEPRQNNSLQCPEIYREHDTLLDEEKIRIKVEWL